MNKRDARLYHHKLIGVDGLSLSLYEKKPMGDKALGRSILLLHSATFSSLPEYDLPVTGYSLMDYFTERGFHVYALDVRGYGNSEKPASDVWITADLVVKDVDVAIKHIKHATGACTVDILGWSWGTQVGGLYTQLSPHNVNKLVLYAPFWNRINADIPELAETRRTNTRENIIGDFVDMRRVEPEVLETFERLCWQYDATSPLGAWLDLRGIAKKPILDPQKLIRPTLLIYGEHDHLIVRDDIMLFYEHLQSAEKKLVIIEDTDHMLHLERNLPLFKAAVYEFLMT